FHNIPRILPPETKVVIERSAWKPPAIFSLIEKWGALSRDEMEKVFNMGVGLVVVLDSKGAAALEKKVAEAGTDCFSIGQIKERRQGEEPLLVL
ncbi:MAG: phosphoribosylformylglycinamidine cyclo-ligase, partial [Deltaproteobacteria bacterium]|nr:phosphoribosylformylglycinamidine cyclo-ligase [Deltaproteobacteria bacterium]